MALHDISEIAQAAVVPSDDSHHGERLVAYVVPQGSKELKINQLLASLKEKLPVICFRPPCVLDRLPLTASGKVDRRALPRQNKIAT